MVAEKWFWGRGVIGSLNVREYLGEGGSELETIFRGASICGGDWVLWKLEELRKSFCWRGRRLWKPKEYQFSVSEVNGNYF